MSQDASQRSLDPRSRRVAGTRHCLPVEPKTLLKYPWGLRTVGCSVSSIQ